MSDTGMPVMSRGGLRAVVIVAVVTTGAIAPFFAVQKCPDGSLRLVGAPPCPPPAVMDAPAFPAAVGFGMSTSGGRGGDVYHVTNTNATGAGSLHEGINSATGPRTIVFDVGGQMTTGLSAVYLNKNDLTIAGETAPGGGFGIKGDLRFENCSNIQVRHLRFRCEPYDAITKRCLWFLYSNNVYVYKCSFSWSTDEMLSFTESTDVTVDTCLMAESMFRFYTTSQETGKSSAFFGDCDKVTFCRNVMTTTAWRMPLFDGGRYQLYENVAYNCAEFAAMALAGVSGHAPDTWVESVSNMRLNGHGAEIRWPAGGVLWTQAGNGFDQGPGDVYLYVAGNMADNDRGNGVLDVVASQWNGAKIDEGTPWTGTDPAWPTYPAPAPIDAAWLTTKLANAGATLPSRDTVDTRIIDDINNRASSPTGTVDFFGSNISETYPESVAAVGGYPTLATGSAPLDTDQDGMPDSYEDAAGLSKTDPSDGPIVVISTGYTNLETYLNTLF